jgi:hypothetical protein
VAVAAFGWLVPAALATPTQATALAPPAIVLDGALSTAGLPLTPAVSRLTVRNAGPVAVRWSIVTEVVGAAADGVAMQAWIPTSGSCTDPAPTMPASASAAPVLVGGATSPLCVRISADGTRAGDVEPRVRVIAQAA